MKINALKCESNPPMTPCSLALHLSGLSQPSVHQQAKAVFNEVGYFADLNRDYANCYLGDEPTRDIR